MTVRTSRNLLHYLARPRMSRISTGWNSAYRLTLLMLKQRQTLYRGHDQCFCFQNYIKCFLDTLIQKMFLQIEKINNFQGELTDISVWKEALVMMWDRRFGDLGFETVSRESSLNMLTGTFFLLAWSVHWNETLGNATLQGVPSIEPFRHILSVVIGKPTEGCFIIILDECA